jgi:uncharacterized protein (TIGR02996 family)
MSEQAAFLAAVLAAPEDDLPRLIYADWLEEHGDPRGEFIRLQVAAHYGDVTAGRAAAALEREFGREWAGPLASWAYQVGYSRGFAESIVIRGEEFLIRVAKIFRHAPIQRVALIGVRDSLKTILRMPYLAYLRGLHLTGCGIGNREAQKLADCRHLQTLTTLRLANNEIGCAGAAALAASHGLPELRNLDLANNDISDWGARSFANSRTLNHLESLNLSGNSISLGGEAALRHSHLTSRVQLAGQRRAAPVTAVC